MSKRSNEEGYCGLIVAIFSLLVALIALIPSFGAWLYPQQPREAEKPSASISTPTSNSTSTPPSISTPSPRESSLISGQWVGTYTCSLGLTGVTVDIDRTENRVIADFSLYPVPENPNIPRGLARYEGDFNSTSRRMSFRRGIWINKPDASWTAYPFHGQFDQNSETFSGEIDGYRCTTINLKKRHR